MKKTNITISLLILILLISSCQGLQNTDTNNENSKITEDEVTNTANETNMPAELYFIKLEDKGANGELIGCDDSVIPVETEIPSSYDKYANIKESLEKLLSIKEREYGDEKLYNAMAGLKLKVDNVIDAENSTKVMLVGEYQISGVCEIPRIKAQILETASQFQEEDENNVEIYINGRAFDEVFSMKGE